MIDWRPCPLCTYPVDTARGVHTECRGKELMRERTEVTLEECLKLEEGRAAPALARWVDIARYHLKLAEGEASERDLEALGAEVARRERLHKAQVTVEQAWFAVAERTVALAACRAEFHAVVHYRAELEGGAARLSALRAMGEELDGERLERIAAWRAALWARDELLPEMRLKHMGW